MNRRNLIVAAAAGAALPLVGRRMAWADEELESLPESNARARALDFVNDAADARGQVYPQGSEQRCANCANYATRGDSRGSCRLFPGFSVPAAGWCSGWTE